MSGNGRRRQHTVARTHLTGFADETGRVSMRLRAGGDALVGVGDATIGKDFYSFHDDTGRRDISIETWFADHVEGPAAGVLRIARAGNTPTAAQTTTLALYLAAMLMRNKLMRQRFTEVDAHTGPLIALTVLLQDQGVDYLTLPVAEQARWKRDAIQFWEQRVRDRDPWEVRRTQLRTMLRQIDQLDQQLETWHYAVDDVGADLLTTSDTAIAVNEAVPAPGWRGVLPDGAWLAVPVDARKIIIGTSGPNPKFAPPSQLGGHGLAEVVNARIAADAFEAIFKHPHTAWPTGTPVNPHAEPLLTPTTTIRPSQPGGTPTFPARYAPIRNPQIRGLLTALGAIDQVE